MVAFFWQDHYDDEEEFMLDVIAYYKSNPVSKFISFMITSQEFESLLCSIGEYVHSDTVTEYLIACLSSSTDQLATVVKKRIEAEERTESEPVEQSTEAQRIAWQLTILETKLFSAIQFVEFLNDNFLEKYMNKQAKNIAKLVKNFNDIVSWASTRIVQQDDTIEFFIDVMQHLMENGSFDSMAAIYFALNSPAVQKLESLWQKVDEEHQDLLQDIQDSIENNKVSEMYAEVAHSTPYIAPLLGKLTRTRSAQHDDTTNHRLNLRRRTEELEILKMVDTMQKNARYIRQKATIKLTGLSSDELLDLVQRAPIDEERNITPRKNEPKVVGTNVSAEKAKRKTSISKDEFAGAIEKSRQRSGSLNRAPSQPSIEIEKPQTIQTEPSYNFSGFSFGKPSTPFTPSPTTSAESPAPDFASFSFGQQASPFTPSPSEEESTKPNAFAFNTAPFTETKREPSPFSFGDFKFGQATTPIEDVKPFSPQFTFGQEEEQQLEKSPIEIPQVKGTKSPTKQQETFTEGEEFYGGDDDDSDVSEISGMDSEEEEEEPEPVHANIGDNGMTFDVQMDKYDFGLDEPSIDGATGFSFGGETAPSTGFGFDLGNQKEETNFSFGNQEPSNEKTTEEPKVMFTFGSNAAVASNEVAPTTGFTFGRASNEPFSFGTPDAVTSFSMEQPAFGTNTLGFTPTFGATTTEPKPETEPTEFSFGNNESSGTSTLAERSEPKVEEPKQKSPTKQEFTEGEEFLGGDDDSDVSEISGMDSDEEEEVLEPVHAKIGENGMTFDVEIDKYDFGLEEPSIDGATGFSFGENSGFGFDNQPSTGFSFGNQELSDKQKPTGFSFGNTGFSFGATATDASTKDANSANVQTAFSFGGMTTEPSTDFGFGNQTSFGGFTFGGASKTGEIVEPDYESPKASPLPQSSNDIEHAFVPTFLTPTKEEPKQVEELKVDEPIVEQPETVVEPKVDDKVAEEPQVEEPKPEPKRRAFASKLMPRGTKPSGDMAEQIKKIISEKQQAHRDAEDKEMAEDEKREEEEKRKSLELKSAEEPKTESVDEPKVEEPKVVEEPKPETVAEEPKVEDKPEEPKPLETVAQEEPAQPKRRAFASKLMPRGAKPTGDFAEQIKNTIAEKQKIHRDAIDKELANDEEKEKLKSTVDEEPNVSVTPATPTSSDKKSPRPVLPDLKHIINTVITDNQQPISENRIATPIHEDEEPKTPKNHAEGLTEEQKNTMVLTPTEERVPLEEMVKKRRISFSMKEPLVLEYVPEASHDIDDGHRIFDSNEDDSDEEDDPTMVRHNENDSDESDEEDDPTIVRVTPQERRRREEETKRLEQEKKDEEDAQRRKEEDQRKKEFLANEDAKRTQELLLKAEMERKKDELPKMFEAKEDYVVDQYGYISLMKGEQILITGKLTADLWEGERLGLSGYVDANYLQEVKPHAELLERVRNRKKISSVDFSNMNLKSEDLTDIVPAIVENTHVKRVNFSGNVNISDDDLDAVVELLQTKRLIDINLSGTSVQNIEKLLDEVDDNEIISLELPSGCDEKYVFQLQDKLKQNANRKQAVLENETSRKKEIKIQDEKS